MPSSHPSPNAPQPTRFEKLSDVRNYFGISTNGLKLYEKEGLARLSREDERGQRYCTLPAAVLLCNAMDYTSYGFTLRETARILLDGTPSDQLAELERLNDDYLAQIEDLVARKRRIEAEIGAQRAHMADSNACQVRRNLDLFTLPIHSHNLVMGPGNEDSNAWWSHAPFVTTGALVQLGADGGASSMEHGPVVDSRDAARLGLPLGHALHFCRQGTPYLWAFVTYPADQMPGASAYEHVRLFMAAHNMEPAGDRVLHRLLRYWDEGEIPMRTDEVFVPLGHLE